MTILRIAAVVTSLSVLAQGAPLAHHPIRSLTSPDTDDLSFLVPLLKDADVVQLGENGHGMAEPSMIKARLVRFLHERLGFTVVAFESSVYLGYQGDVRAATAPARTTLTTSTLGVWHTEEVLPLFEYLRGQRVGPRPLRLAGFDVQPIGAGKNTRPAFFRRLVAVADDTYGAEVETFDRDFLAEYDKGNASRLAYFRANRDRLVAFYDRLAAFISAHLAELQRALGREAPIAGRQEAASMAAYVRYQTAADMTAYAETRDRAMADNVLAILRDLYPGEKIVVWAHNYHVSLANERIEPRAEIFPGVRARSMGGFLAQALGRRLYTIGQCAFTGEAVDNGRTPYVIAPAAAGQLENRLMNAGGALAFFDLRALISTPAGAWLGRPVTWRYNEQLDQTLVPAEQFDALISIARVSRPHFLY